MIRNAKNTGCDGLKEPRRSKHYTPSRYGLTGGLLYYVRIASLLDQIAAGGVDVCGVSPGYARKLLDVLSRFAYIKIDNDGLPVPGPDTQVTMMLFRMEYLAVIRLLQWMLAGMAVGYDLPMTVEGPYTDALMAEADEFLARRRQEQERCLDAIRTYVAEQEAAGRRALKKHVAAMGFSSQLVRMMWQQFDAERAAAAAASAPPSEQGGRTEA